MKPFLRKQTADGDRQGLLAAAETTQARQGWENQYSHRSVAYNTL